MKKWQLYVLALLLIGAGGYWFVAIPAVSTPGGNASKALYTPGPFEVTGETFSIVDESRPTQAYKDFQGLSHRELNGQIWRPANAGTAGPMLIYSHGFMSFRQEGLYLARFLASHGYTVVAADYPLTGFYAPEGPLMEDVINQPGDISFLIDSMLGRNADPADALYNTVDPDKIAVAGVSLGGLTTTLATFHHSLRDPRIAAAISIAGPSSIFTADFYAGAEAPLLMIYGDSDAIVPYEVNAIPARQAYPGSILVTLKKASHAGFAQPASTIMRFIKNPDEVGCRTMQEELTGDIDHQTEQFMALLGSAEDGIDVDAKLNFCSSAPIPVAMEAARQHMFTTLAAYTFLESVFAEDTAKRAAARDYLLAIMPQENHGEVEVTQYSRRPTTLP